MGRQHQCYLLINEVHVYVKYYFTFVESRCGVMV